MIHRVAYGSLERFIGILIEHFAGAFPAWLAPVQVKILPITDRHMEYAKKVAKEMWNQDIRVAVDERNEKIGYKIREAQMQKIPYVLVVGDKEMENGTVAVRKRGEGDLGPQETEVFTQQLLAEIAAKK